MSEHPSLTRRVTWRQFAIVLNRLPSELHTRIHAAIGVTGFEWQVLELLAENPAHSMALKDIAKLTGSSLSRLSHAISQLQAGDLVRRQRRGTTASTLAELTRRGAERVAEGRPIYMRAVSELVFGDLDPKDIAALRRIMAVIGAHLEADAT